MFGDRGEQHNPAEPEELYRRIRDDFYFRQTGLPVPGMTGASANGGWLPLPAPTTRNFTATLAADLDAEDDTAKIQDVTCNDWLDGHVPGDTDCFERDPSTAINTGYSGLAGDVLDLRSMPGMSDPAADGSWTIKALSPSIDPQGPGSGPPVACTRRWVPVVVHGQTCYMEVCCPTSGSGSGGSPPPSGPYITVDGPSSAWLTSGPLTYVGAYANGVYYSVPTQSGYVAYLYSYTPIGPPTAWFIGVGTTASPPTVGNSGTGLGAWGSFNGSSWAGSPDTEYYPLGGSAAGNPTVSGI